MEHPFNLDLQEALDSDEAYSLLPDGTWLSGGCGLLAHTLEKLIPGGELIVVGRIAEKIPDHLAYRIEVDGELVYLDYNGVQTEDEIIETLRTELHGADISVSSLQEMQSSGIDVQNLYWKTENALILGKIMENQIGIFDRERVSLQWCEELDDWDDNDIDCSPGIR